MSYYHMFQTDWLVDVQLLIQNISVRVYNKKVHIWFSQKKKEPLIIKKENNKVQTVIFLGAFLLYCRKRWWSS